MDKLLSARIDTQWGSSELAFQRRLVSEFPHLRFGMGGTGQARAEIDAEEWLDPSADLMVFDRRIHAAEDAARPRNRRVHLMITGAHQGRRALAARQIVTRYQRLFWRRNNASCCARFDAVLGRLSALHDLKKPLVRADYDHALDVWQWVLRIAPFAGMALQIAALFHDVERLVSESDARIEHRASDYQRFKNRHAERGSELLRSALSGIGLHTQLIRRASDLVAHHEIRADDPELAVLGDADALSFFALNSAGFLAYFGPEHTATKVAYTVRRMRGSARRRLNDLRLPPAIAVLAQGAEPPPVAAVAHAP